MNKTSNEFNEKINILTDIDEIKKIVSSMSSHQDLNFLDKKSLSSGKWYLNYLRKILHDEINDWTLFPVIQKQTNFNKETVNSIHSLLIEFQKLQNSNLKLKSNMQRAAEHFDKTLQILHDLAVSVSTIEKKIQDFEINYSVSTIEKKIQDFEINNIQQNILNSTDKGEYWILKSGICISDRKDPNFGAVYYSYDSERGYDFIHAESTGYLISFLKHLYHLYKDPNLINLAKISGDWLANLCTKYDGIVIMGIRDGNDVKMAYTFDNGICCKGFLDLYELTGDKKYLDCAENIANWLVENAINPDGSIKPEFDIDANKFLEGEDSWWRASGSFHSKIVMSLLQIYSINKQERFRQAAMKVCQWCLQQQKPDGSFTSNKYFKSVNIHPLCYTIEALLYAYAMENNQDYILAAQKAIDWMHSMQEPDGSFLLIYGDGTDKTKPIYAIAQFVRVSLLLYSITHEERLLDASRRASKFLIRFQSFDHDSKSFGGFYEHITSYEFIAKHRQVYASKFIKNSKISGFGTMFAIQSLDMLNMKLSHKSNDSLNFKDDIKNLF